MSDTENNSLQDGEDSEVEVEVKVQLDDGEQVRESLCLYTDEFGGGKRKVSGTEEVSLKKPKAAEVRPAESVEGWILFVTNIHPEAQEDDIYDFFADHGEIVHVDLNLDRRTGFVKGYALVEYREFEDAQKALNELQGKKLYKRPLSIDWALVEH